METYLKERKYLMMSGLSPLANKTILFTYFAKKEITYNHLLLFGIYTTDVLRSASNPVDKRVIQQFYTERVRNLMPWYWRVLLWVHVRIYTLLYFIDRLTSCQCYMCVVLSYVSYYIRIQN